MTSRCCWFIQPASAMRTNRNGWGNGGMRSRLPEADSPVAGGVPDLKSDPLSKNRRSVRVDRVFGHHGDRAGQCDEEKSQRIRERNHGPRVADARVAFSAAGEAPPPTDRPSRARPRGSIELLDLTGTEYLVRTGVNCQSPIPNSQSSHVWRLGVGGCDLTLLLTAEHLRPASP